MVLDQTVPNRESLSLGARIFVFLIGVASAPGYLTALILVYGYIEELIVGRYYSAPSYIRRADMMKMAVTVLSVLGILTHTLALLMASIGSFSGIGGRGKILAWKIVVGGFLGLAFAYWVIWVPYIHQ